VQLTAVTALLGVVAGTYGAFATQVTVGGLPVGPVVVIVGNLVAGLLLACGARRMGPVLGYVSGWVLSTLYLSVGRAEGDVVITSQGRSYLTLFGGMLALLPGLAAAPRMAPSPHEEIGR
jgi:hypothetical protein